jgi:hypothetical protein
MRTLLTDWKFHKAGQGCFYSGIINANGRDRFSFVYDCGSTNGAGILRQEIARFEDEMATAGKTEIDLLVISHYDADHVNQLPSLLKNLNCRIAVLPYLTNLERLKIYYSTEINDGTQDDDYSSFIRDPASYLSNLGVEQIIFIDGNDADADLGNPIGPNNFPADHNELTMNSTKQEDYPTEVSLAAFIGLKLLSSLNNPEQIHLVNSAPGTRIATANGFINAGIYWEFYFHIKEQTAALIEEFKDQLRAIFGIALAGGYVTPDELNIVLGSAKARGKIKKQHIRYFNDINRTGLVVLHGPISQRHTECYRKRPLYAGRYCFTLLNGDCDLFDINYPAYITAALPETKIFQVPHHGSRYNWSFHRELDHLRTAHLIVNHARGSKHPHPHVVALIKAKYPLWKLKHNTEIKTFHYHITSYI